MRVAEVGREMQEKLRGASVVVRGSDLAAHVEALYLAGAGVGTVCVDAPLQNQIQNINSQVSIVANASSSTNEIDPRVRSLDSAAARVASGSLAALARMKEIFAAS
jgi:molybdopterin/thiamine biosynthesis adenylyltransferase